MANAPEHETRWRHAVLPPAKLFALAYGDLVSTATDFRLYHGDSRCRRLIGKSETQMPVFDFHFTVAAPLEAVSDFHRDTRALKRLTPPPTLVQLHEVEPLGEGSVSRFTLWVGPLPLRWEAVHRNVSERGFTDVQAEGPARKWEHTHTFTPVTAHTTEIREHIEYEHGAGFWGVVTRVLFARPNLYLMFTYRKHATRWHLRGRK